VSLTSFIFILPDVSKRKIQERCQHSRWVASTTPRRAVRWAVSERA